MRSDSIEDPATSLIDNASPMGSDVNLLPCNIDYNGPAPIKSYFITERNLADSSLVSHFRGRRLIGKEVLLPKHIIGAHAVVGPREGAAIGRLEIANTFSSINQWEHDIQPEESLLNDCFDYLELSNTLHSCEDE